MNIGNWINLFSLIAAWVTILLLLHEKSEKTSRNYRFLLNLFDQV